VVGSGGTGRVGGGRRGSSKPAAMAGGSGESERGEGVSEGNGWGCIWTDTRARVEPRGAAGDPWARPSDRTPAATRSAPAATPCPSRALGPTGQPLREIPIFVCVFPLPVFPLFNPVRGRFGKCGNWIKCWSLSFLQVCQKALPPNQFANMNLI